VHVQKTLDSKIPASYPCDEKRFGCAKAAMRLSPDELSQRNTSMEVTYGCQADRLKGRGTPFFPNNSRTSIQTKKVGFSKIAQL